MINGAVMWSDCPWCGCKQAHAHLLLEDGTPGAVMMTVEEFLKDWQTA